MIESLYTSGTISKKEYDEMLERIETKVISDTSIASLLDSFEKYLKQENYSKHTVSGYVANTKSYFEFLHDNDVDELPKNTEAEISVELVQQWLNSLATKGYSSVSIRRYKNSFSKFVEYINELHNMDVADISTASIPKTPDSEEDIDAITDSEVRELAENANSLRDKLMILIIYELGLRRQEVIDLMKSDIDNKTKVVKIRKGENVNRIGILSNSTYQLFVDYDDEWKAYIEEMNDKRKARGDKNVTVDSKYVFQTLRSEKISYAVVFKAIADASESTYGKEKEITTETLRRSRRIYYFSQGLDTQKVQSLMGDANYHVCKRSLRLAQIMYPDMLKKTK